ncbi:phytol kinase [Saccharicrinis carchari]|uniref:Phytol kinase n=1 Tax=Saccharicrinis carchari TaxID=1168039 RepID=A0A521B4K0_SACCC|nr:phosphatidate cytidylyltransferase [Saccharicrinis carchari]SMO41620.1 phytol kinase [Saccharicrinis carchari]
MVSIIALSFFYLVGIAFLLIFNELNYRRFKIKGEITRKFAHFASILAVIPMPYMFNSHWYVLILAAVFFIILLITQHSKYLNSIHDIKRKSIGSYLLPLAIYATFLASYLYGNKFFFILPMLILAICDPMAAILGMNVKKYNGRIVLFGHKFQKTWLGSGAFFAMSLIISLIALYYYRDLLDLKTVWLSVAIATVGSLAELFSWRGSDNITIPISILFILVIGL